MRLRSTRLVSYGRGRTAWTPEQIQTALWLDAADTSTITLSGPRVSQWSDKSGNGRNATQGVAANQPGWGVGRNLLLWSEAFDNAAWTKQGVSITQNSGIAPDGTLTADKIIPNTTAGAAHVVFNAAAVSVVNGVATWTVRAKAAEYNFVTLGAVVPAGRYSATFNLTTGATTKTATAGSPTSTGNSAKQLANGWWELSITATTTTAAASYILLGASSSGTPTQDGSLNITDAGDGTSGVLLWGAQVNPGATADQYQKTTTGAQPLSVGMNSLPTLAFDGTNDLLALPNGTIPSGDSNYTMFICMELGTLASSHFVGTAPSGVATGNWLGVISGNTVGNWWLNYGVSGGVTQVGQDIYGGWYDSALSTAYFARNGGTVLSQVQAVDRNSLTTQQWIGANGTTLTQYLQGKIAEIIVTGSTISTDNQQRIEGYFAWKWGLTAKLPSNHPYKNYPPTI